MERTSEHPQLQGLEGLGVDGDIKGVACLGCDACVIISTVFMGFSIVFGEAILLGLEELENRSPGLLGCNYYF